MKVQRIAIVLASMMVLASLAGFAARPTARAADRGAGVVLEAIIPPTFGEWRLLPEQGAQVINPQTKELLDKLYSQVLSRTYVNASGYRVMLSLAYGDDQRGDLQLHKPEVCYPAQGFALHNNIEGNVPTPFGSIPARRLETSLGARKEPVTYWFTYGGQAAVKTKWEQRMIELKLGLSGQIPDGLLFRVSSIDPDPPRAFRMQEAFVADLLGAVQPAERVRLSGLAAASAAQ